MNEKINELINKILACKKENKLCFFSNKEIEFITNNISISFHIDTETNKNSIRLFHLLCNTKNNLDVNFVNYAKNILSIPYMFLSDEDIQEVELFGIRIKDISKTSKSINGKTLSIEQNRIYELFDRFNICLKAGTGIGKTFITTNYLIDRYRNFSKIDEKFIFIVPTEILESQIINELKKKNEDIEDKIGNSIIEHDIFIGTWEKLIFVINPKEISIKINTLIIDEAHYLFLENDERSNFFNHIINLYLREGNQISKVIMVSPFEFNREKISKIFDIQNIRFVYIDYNKRNAINKWNFNENEMVNDDFNNSKEYENMIENNIDSVSCILVSSKEKAKQRARQLFENKKLLFEIKKYQLIDLNKKEINEIEEELNSEKWKSFEKYLNFKYMKNGICYLTADIPDIIKNKIIDLVKNRYIRFVVATSLIISGVDLPFDITYMDTNKINRMKMTTNDVVNYFGRAGRIGHYKKAYAAGFSYIKITCENNRWWKENKESIIKKLNSGETEVLNETSLKKEDGSYYVRSYEKYRETNDQKYIYDPRINPETVDLIKKIQFDTNDYKYVVSVLCRKWVNNKENLNLMSIKDMISVIFLLYKINKYKNASIFAKGVVDNFSKFIKDKKLNTFNDICINFHKFKSENNNGAIYNMHKSLRNLMSNMNFYSKYNYNLEKSMRPFMAMKYKCENEENLTKDVEYFVENIKNIGKFHLMNFMNHLYLLLEDNKIEYTSFSIMNSFFITDNQFYRFLIKNNFICKYVSKIIVDNNALKQWKRINKLDNKIDLIYEKINNLGKNTKLYKILKQDDEFCDELKKYINELGKSI